MIDMTQAEIVKQSAEVCKAFDVPFNPKLPRNFDNTANDERPASHKRWWHRPFIVSTSWDDEEAFTRARTDQYAAGQIAKLPEDRERWFKAWPTGVRFCVRCLDGGCWDRSTNWGMFATLSEAIEVARLGPVWRKSA